MLVREDKYLHRDIQTYKDVDWFQRTCSVLVTRLQPRNRMEEDQLRSLVGSVCNALYRHLRAEMNKRRPLDTATREEKVRHNLSVTQLKREMVKADEKIRQKFRRVSDA